MAEEQLGQVENADLEKRRRRIKIFAIILLLLLLALLFLLFLYLRPLVRPSGPLRFLFSVHGFNKPLNVSTDSDNNIYVSDTGNNRFMVFDKTGEFVRRIGKGKGKNRLYGVYGSAVDEQAQRVYIADWTRRKIHVFSLKGKFLFRFPRNSGAAPFGDMGFTPFDLDIYKGKVYVTSNNGIYVFTKNGEFRERWGKRGKELGSYDFPNGITIDKKSGTIYVADQLNRRIVALKGKNKVQWMLGKPDENGEIVSFFALPRDVTLDSKGRLFVTDTFHHEIVVITKKGELIASLGERGTKDTNLNFPEGITVTKDDVIYIADRENGRIQALRLGTLRTPPGVDVAEAKASYVGPKGTGSKKEDVGSKR